MVLVIESTKLRDQSFGVLSINLDRAGNKEVLLLRRACLPIVRFCDCDNKSKAASPRPVLSLPVVLGRQGTAREALNRTELFQIPSLAYAETPVVVLSCLVHAHSPGTSDRNYDQTRLPVLRRTIWRRRRRGVCGVLLNANVRDIALAHLAIGVGLAEARLDDAPLLVLEALGARRASRRWTLLLLWRTQAGLRVHGAVRAGHVQCLLRAIAHAAHVAVAVWRSARHGDTGKEEAVKVAALRRIM